MKDEQGFEGVWRTVRGRRVFIRSGEELGKAMERSGKFEGEKNTGKSMRTEVYAKDGKEFLKDLRKEDNQSLINKLNYNQQKYNKWFDIYKFDRHDEYTNRTMEICLNNMNKIKQVFQERKVNVEFRNGWELI